MRSARGFVVAVAEVLPPGSSVQVSSMHILSKGEEAMLKREQNLQVQ